MREGGALRSLARSIPAVVRRDYVASTVAHWTTLASGLLLFHLVAQRAGTAGFAYYQVARGMVATLQPFLQIGLVPALHRFLPRCGTLIRIRARQSFLVQVVLLDVIGFAALALADDLARLFGLPDAEDVLAISVLTTGTCLCTVAMAALRGCGQVRQANVVYLAGLGLLPLAAFAVTAAIDEFLVMQGLLMAAVAIWGIAIAGRGRDAPLRTGPPAAGSLPSADALPAIGAPPAAAAVEPPAPRPGRRTAPAPGLRTMIRYGIRRAPGEIALPAIFAFPTFYVAGAAPGGPDAGYIGFATSAVTLICSLFGMLTPVLLPRISGAFHSLVPSTALTRGLKLLPPLAALLAAAGTLILALAAGPVVHRFLGPEFGDAARILRLGLLSSIPFAAFYAARPTLDALLDAPVITRLLLGCLLIQVILTYATGNACSPAAAALIGLGASAGVLGLLSYLALLKVVPPVGANAT